MVGAVKRPPAVGDDDLSRLVRVWADIWGRRREEDSELVLEVIRILTSESPPEAQVSKVTDPVTFMTVPRSRPG